MIKATFKKSLKFYKWIAIAYFIIYPIYIVIDDMVLIRKIDNGTDLLFMLGIQLGFCVVIFLFLSVYFFIAVGIIGLVRKYVLKR